MTDPVAGPPPPGPKPAAAAPDPASDPARNGVAGAMLRAARQQQGLHIAALAAAIKVSPAKLESLESGRYHELLDIAFSRALAQTVCRMLKIDPTPVLAQMPGAPPDALGRVDGGLNMPYRERPGRVVPGDWAPWRHPVLWLVALLLIAAAAFVLVPATVVRDLALPGSAATLQVMPPGGAAAGQPAGADAGAAPAAGAASGPGLAPKTASPGELGTNAAPTLGAAATPRTELPGAISGALVGDANPNPNANPNANANVNANVNANGDAVLLRALQPTWVQAVDGTGQTLMARLLPAGETVEMTVTPPLRLKIGNVSGTELSFRGHRVDLSTATRDNIANVTLP